jgi:uncharacterized protein (DUF1501 family)
MNTQACPDFFRSQFPHRRDILRAGSLGLFGLGLPTLLQGREATRKPPRRAAKACIFLFMWGGPAHQDTWDPKPEAPAQYRGEFKPIQTRVPGLQICEHLPRLAKMADRLAVIRSLTHGDVNHTTATHWPLTGHISPRPGSKLADDWPSIGAVLARLGRGRDPLPPFVSMMPRVPNGAPRFVEQSHGQGAGWLGPLYSPLRIDEDASKPEYKVGDFEPDLSLAAGRDRDRQALLRRLDRRTRAMADNLEASALGSHYRRAFDLLSSSQARSAFDLSREPARLRERYGMNLHGQSVLQARRLVEAGVPLVTVFWPNDGLTNVSVYWDTHNRNFIDLKTRLCPVSDQATSALLEDLQQRGLLDETLVVWCGEMGRTPRVGQSVEGGAGAGRDGRDHWPHCFSALLAGGGIRGGVVYGASDRYAAYPSRNPTSPADLVATIYRCLGVDPRIVIRDRLNRPFTLCEGSPIEPILA